MHRDKILRGYLEDLLIKDVKKQSRELASKKNKSELVKKEADALMDLQPGVIIAEWKEKAPLFVRYVHFQL